MDTEHHVDLFEYMPQFYATLGNYLLNHLGIKDGHGHLCIPRFNSTNALVTPMNATVYSTRDVLIQLRECPGLAFGGRTLVCAKSNDDSELSEFN